MALMRLDEMGPCRHSLALLDPPSGLEIAEGEVRRAARDSPASIRARLLSATAGSGLVGWMKRRSASGEVDRSGRRAYHMTRDHANSILLLNGSRGLLGLGPP